MPQTVERFGVPNYNPEKVVDANILQAFSYFTRQKPNVHVEVVNSGQLRNHAEAKHSMWSTPLKHDRAKFK